MVDILAVTLQVLNADNSVGLSYKLPTETITNEITRNPIVFPLPTTRIDDNSIFNNRPIAWSLDFGMMSETIVMTGVLSDNSQIPGSDIPGIATLREVVRTHWANLKVVEGSSGAIILRSNGGVRVVVEEGPGQAPGTQNYQGLITQFRSTRTGGTLRWDWTMAVTVSVWPVMMRAI